MDKEVEKILIERAKILREWMVKGKHIPKGDNHFHGYVSYKILKPSDGVIGFQFNDKAKIYFKQIQPDNVIKTTVHPPRLLNKKKNDSSTTEIVNQSPAVVERSYDFSVENSTTQTEDVGVSVTAGIEQKISYGGAASPVSGETSFSLSVNSSYNKSKGSSKSTTRQSTTTVECPPWTKMYVTAESSVANYEQKIDVVGGIEHSVEIWSHGDCDFKFKSWSGWCDMIKGDANDDVYTWNHTHTSKYKGLAAKYRKSEEWWTPYIYFAARKPGINYTHKTTFEDAVVGDVRVTSEDLKPV